MDIDWIASAEPSAVVGCAPDGGFFVHASLHISGVETALQRAEQAGIPLCYFRGEVYLPMPWLRSDLAAMLKQTRNGVFASETEGTVTVLNETLPLLLQQAESRREEAHRKKHNRKKMRGI